MFQAKGIVFVFTLILFIQPSFAQTGNAGNKSESLDFAAEDNTGNRRIKRSALVVGANNYTNADKLGNTMYDARVMADSLKHLGFQVDTLYNPSTTDFLKALNSWGQVLKNSREALFYYAGHGFNLGSSAYMLPITKAINFNNAAQVDSHCISLQTVQAVIEEAKVPIQIFFLDACRTYTEDINPEDKDFGVMYLKYNDMRGFGILYGTSAGTPASDGQPNGHGIFTGNLLDAIKPGISFNDMAKQVINNVKMETSFNQIPRALQISLTDYYLNPKKAGSELALGSAPVLVPNTMPIASRQAGKPSAVPDSIWTDKIRLIEKGDFLATLDNTAAALKCYAQAANLGNAEGYYRLGCAWQFGLGVKKNYKLALENFKKGAEAENTDCIFKLGVLRYFPQYGMQDYAKAAKYFSLAADKGNAAALNNLGIMRFNGIFFVPDHKIGLACIRKAAELGNPDAMNNLGYAYYMGKAETEDFDQAIEWFNKAAERENVSAMANLGMIYQTGAIVDTDKVLAGKWYLKASQLSKNLGNTKEANTYLLMEKNLSKPKSPIKK